MINKKNQTTDRFPVFNNPHIVAGRMKHILNLIHFWYIGKWQVSTHIF